VKGLIRIGDPGKLPDSSAYVRDVSRTRSGFGTAQVLYELGVVALGFGYSMLKPRSRALPVAVVMTTLVVLFVLLR
jgi:hypothetical protein